MSDVFDVVVDLETFDTGPGAAIASIGARSLSGSQFYVVVKGSTGTVNLDTVGWWLVQREEVREAVAVPFTASEPDALVEFAAWLEQTRGVRSLRLWGSEDFDTVILSSAYARHGYKRPWSYREVRSLRTIYEAAGVDEDAIPWREGAIEHIASDCAEHAATALALALERLP